MNHYDVGMWGEELVAQRLSNAGEVELGAGPADLTFEGVPVEVKTARLGWPRGRQRKPGFQFCLHRDGRDGVEAPVVVFVLAGESIEFFIVPAEEIGAAKKAVIPAEVDGYTGKYAPYRDRWDVLAAYVPATDSG